MREAHRKLDAGVVAKAQRLAAAGLPMASIAAGCRVSPSAMRAWLRNAREGNGSALEVALLAAIEEGSAEGEQRLLEAIHSSAATDWRPCTWLLAHSPRWRSTWADQAAIRAEVRRTVATVVGVIGEAGLPPDQERLLLLRLQAAGIGTEAMPEA